MIRRLRSLMRSLEQQSTRDATSTNRDGLMHGIMDKGASHSMRTPYRKDKSGKDANTDDNSLTLSFMMHCIFGFGLVIVLGFPWLKTKADFNLTCYLMALQTIFDIFGYIPRHISEHFDGGDENISKYAVAFWGLMIGLSVVDTVTLTRMPKGHTHNGADGWIAYIGRIIKGFLMRGVRVVGRSCQTVQNFVRIIVPAAYPGKSGTGRLLTVKFLAANFQWKAFLEPYIDEDLDGITSGLHVKRKLKQTEEETALMLQKKKKEIHHILLSKLDGVVYMKYKSLWDLVSPSNGS